MRLSIDIKELKSQALSLVDDHARQAMDRIDQGRSSEYAIKADEARDLSQETPVLDAEAEARGITRDELAQMVIDAQERSQGLVREVALVRGPACARIRGAKDRAEIARVRSKATQALNAIGQGD